MNDEVEDAEVVEDTAAVAVPGSVPPFVPETDYTEGGVPTFDYVRDQIESRYATSIGAKELAPSVDEQFDAREKAGKDRLEQIRRALRQEKPAGDA